MAIAFVSSVSATPGANGGATSAIDTTGANLLVVVVASYFGGFTPVVTDSKGNTYTGLTEHGRTWQSCHRIYYVLTPIVGASHTFTAAIADSYPAIIVYAFSGVASYHSESGSATGGATSLASGNVTPSTNNALIITGSCGFNSSVTDSVSTGGFSTPTQLTRGGPNMQGSAAYYVQPTAAVINPTWNYSASQIAAISTTVFLETVSTTSARLSQLPIEVGILSDAPIIARLSQLPIEILINTSIIPPTSTETTQFLVIMP